MKNEATHLLRQLEDCMDTPTEPKRKLFINYDRSFLITITALVLFGLVVLFSASQAIGYVEFSSSFYFFKHQLLELMLGIIAFVFFAAYDYHKLLGKSGLIGGFGALLLVLVLVPHLGVSINGSQRWLMLGPLFIQPAEIAKLTLTIYTAAWLARRKETINNFREGFLPYMIISFCACMLVVIEKDLGTTLILGAIFVASYIIAGGRWRYTLLYFALLILFALLLIVLEPYRIARLEAFFNPWQHALGKGFQQVQSLLAIGSGGIVGQGLGHSISSYLWIPEGETDFIAAILGQEAGFVGITLLLLLFGAFAFYGYRIAIKAPDKFGMILAGAVTSWIVVQAVINLSAVSSLVPVTGVPLPFVSYGGSSLISVLAGSGILMNISKQGVISKWDNDAQHSNSSRRYRRSYISRFGRG